MPRGFLLVVKQSLDTNLTQNRVMMNTRRIMIGLFEPKDAVNTNDGVTWLGKEVRERDTR